MGGMAGRSAVFVALLLSASALVSVGSVRVVSAASDIPVTTVAGGLGSGPATNLSVSPIAMAVSGNDLYLADSEALRRVDLSTGLSVPVAANPWNLTAPVDPNSLHGPCGLAVGADGTLYIAEPGQIDRLDALDHLSVVATGIRNQTTPCPITVDNSGDIVVGSGVSALEHIDPVTGTHVTVPLVDGNNHQIVFGLLHSMSTLPNGDILLDGTGEVTPSGVTTSFAGGGSTLGDGGPATAAQVSPQGAAVAPDGSVFISEDTRIRRIDTSGIISTYAGDGNFGTSGDGGPPAAAEIDGGGPIAIDSAGVVYVAQRLTGQVRSYSSTVRVVAGVPRTVDASGDLHPLFYGGDGGPAVDAADLVSDAEPPRSVGWNCAGT